MILPSLIFTVLVLETNFSTTRVRQYCTTEAWLSGRTIHLQHCRGMAIQSRNLLRALFSPAESLAGRQTGLDSPRWRPGSSVYGRRDV